WKFCYRGSCGSCFGTARTISDNCNRIGDTGRFYCRLYYWNFTYKGKINNLLSGILMLIELYSINLRIMDSPQLSLLNETTFKTQLEDLWEKTGIDEWLNNLLAITGMERFPSTWGIVIIMLVFVIIIKILLDIFLKTEV